jgi:regulator of cell morphogenesis and NO signaling
MDTAFDQTNSGHGHSAWQTQPPAAIVEFILTRFHEPLSRDLPILVAGARDIESAERGQALCPTGLGEHLEQIRLSVESHLAKEEKILFPLIVAGRGALALMPIRVMMSEHEDHQENLAKTRALTHDFALPADASPAWRDLYRALQRLDGELQQHIALENNVLFPRVMGSDLP